MNHLEKFLGTYEISKERLERLRDIICNTAEQFVPDDYLDQIAASEGSDMDIELKWVKVPDPTSESEEPRLDILPVLYVTRGGYEDEYEAGLYTLALYGKLPNGEEQPVGSIYTREKSSRSGISLNEVGDIGWDSADAEIFLKLAESALQAQYTS